MDSKVICPQLSFVEDDISWELWRWKRLLKIKGDSVLWWRWPTELHFLALDMPFQLSTDEAESQISVAVLLVSLSPQLFVHYGITCFASITLLSACVYKENNKTISRTLTVCESIYACCVCVCVCVRVCVCVCDCVYMYTCMGMLENFSVHSLDDLIIFGTFLFVKCVQFW